MKNNNTNPPFILDNILRKNIKQLKPYASARDEFKGQTENMVFLDANENPFETGFNRYPDPQQTSVKHLLAKQKGVSEKQILLGNGSDEVLDLIFRVFCEPNIDNIITLPPTYGMYTVLAAVNAIKVQQVLLTTDFQPDIERFLNTKNKNSKIVFLCSPNNPTANSFDADKIKTILEYFNGIVVIDEAYIDFSNQNSWVSQLSNYPNLIVTQTLSKAYGMAGIRLGACYASQAIIEALNKIKPPYNVNVLTQQKAIERLHNPEQISLEIKHILQQRAILMKALQGIPFVENVYPSEANFILVKVDNATHYYNKLIEQGVVVRNRTHESLCKNCLRFTVGTPEENKLVLNALNQLSKA